MSDIICQGKGEDIWEISSNEKDYLQDSGWYHGVRQEPTDLLFARNNDNSVPRTIEALLPPK